MTYPKPTVQEWTFNVLSAFRLGGRTYNPGDVLDRRHLAIGPDRIRKLIASGHIEVA